MLQNENLFLWDCQVTDKLTMPMPGTIGSAKIVFKEDQMKNFTVSLGVKFIFDVDAEDMDEASRKARHFFKTMKHQWGEGADVIWHDHLVTNQTVTEELDDEIA